jgi:hypothetical protein
VWWDGVVLMAICITLIGITTSNEHRNYVSSAICLRSHITLKT